MESVDIATAQGAVQQLRATVPHRSSVAAAAASPLQRRQCTKRMWTTGLHSWHKLTGVRIHCHCTRCCAAPEGYLSTAMVATLWLLHQQGCATELQLELELERLQLRDESTASQV